MTGIQSADSMETWMRMLDQVQESIERALQEVDEHERQLIASEASAASEAWLDKERHLLEQIDQQFRGLEGHQEASRRMAADIQESLADDERAVNEWSVRTTTARQRLATMTASRVS